MFVNIFVVCMCLFVNVCVFLRHMCMCLPGVHVCEQYVQLCVRVLCASDAFAAGDAGAEGLLDLILSHRTVTIDSSLFLVARRPARNVQ
jgi:hypothetical protein